MEGFASSATAMLLAVQLSEGRCPAPPFLSLNSAPACSLPPPSCVSSLPWAPQAVDPECLELRALSLGQALRHVLAGMASGVEMYG